jgi:hypothetical protein
MCLTGRRLKSPQGDNDGGLLRFARNDFNVIWILETKDKRYMTRNELIKTLGRYVLLLIMAVVVFLLGNKVVAANNCNACAGKGICNGKTDCNKY